MKKCLFTILGVIFPLLVSSQTIIATKSGDFIKGYNVDIGEDYVYYTQDISEESPINKIAKNNVFAIRKENGEQVVFDSKAEELADSIYIREEGYGDISLPDVDIDNYEGFLLQKGNVVYVESGDTDYEKAGANRLREHILEDGFWKLASRKEQAHFIFRYRVITKGADHLDSQYIDTRSGLTPKEHKKIFDSYYGIGRIGANESVDEGPVFADRLYNVIKRLYKYVVKEKKPEKHRIFKYFYKKKSGEINKSASK